VMRRHRRQEVTGLVVNDRVAVPRDTLRRFRALLHQIEATGPEGKSWGAGGNVLTAAVGFAQFVRMVDAEAGAPLVAKAQGLARRHGVTLPSAVADDFRLKAAKGEPPLDRWWQPNEKRPPAPDPVLASHIEAQETAKTAPPPGPPAPAAPQVTRTSAVRRVTSAAAPSSSPRPSSSAAPSTPAPERRTGTFEVLGNTAATDTERQAAAARVQLPPRPRDAVPKVKQAKKKKSSSLLWPMLILGMVLGALRVPYPVIAGIVLILMLAILIYGLLKGRR
jgi:hypothetical protein